MDMDMKQLEEFILIFLNNKIIKKYAQAKKLYNFSKYNNGLQSVSCSKYPEILGQ